MENEILKRAGAEETIGRLEKLLKGKADAYEVFFTHDTGFGAEARGREIDALKVRSNTGVGLRTISKGRQGFGFSSVLGPDALEELVAKTIGGSIESASDAYLMFPAPVKAAVAEDALEIFDPSYGAVAEEEKLESALEIERSALSSDARIKRVRKASYSESVHSARILNSNGVDMTQAATYYSASVTAVAEEGGESQMGWEMDTGHKRTSIEPSRVGQGAARQALRMLGARKLKTVRCPAVIENTVVCELLESLASSFLADNVHKGKSMLAGKAGKKIASGALSVWDDGLLPGGWSTSVFDGEGMVKKRTPLLIEGVCQGYLYDTYWAARMGAGSTGNAVRSNFKSFPGVGITNLYIEKGEKGFDELLSDAGKGLLITEVLGVHTINTVSGDYSLGAAGFWVEGGRQAYPVRGMAISGNLLDLFSKVGGCGSDMRFIGSIGAPSLIINEIEASGS